MIISRGKWEIPIPDDVTSTQFILDHVHRVRPRREFGVPWFIDEDTGRKVGLEEVSILLSCTCFPRMALIMYT